MKNKDRALVSVVRDVCAQLGISCEALSEGWLLVLRRGDVSAHVFGYNFGLNSATSQMIAQDKSATSDVLGIHGVPRVDHRLFHGPQMGPFVPMTGNWAAMVAYFESNRGDVVCKRNDGTGGADVYRAQTVPQLEASVHKILKRYRAVALSPYIPIEAEYRVVIVLGRCIFAYSKRIPTVTGDGVRSLLELLHRSFASDVASFGVILSLARDSEWDLQAIVPDGTQVQLGWKHNLGLGSSAERVDLESDVGSVLRDLGLRAVGALGMSMASVDIAFSRGEYAVLEVNSGIMMESLVRQWPDGRDLAEQVYGTAIAHLFRS